MSVQVEGRISRPMLATIDEARASQDFSRGLLRQGREFGSVDFLSSVSEDLASASPRDNASESSCDEEHRDFLQAASIRTTIPHGIQDEPSIVEIPVIRTTVTDGIQDEASMEESVSEATDEREEIQLAPVVRTTLPQGAAPDVSSEPGSMRSVQTTVQLNQRGPQEQMEVGSTAAWAPRVRRLNYDTGEFEAVPQEIRRTSNGCVSRGLQHGEELVWTLQSTAHVRPGAFLWEVSWLGHPPGIDECSSVSAANTGDSNSLPACIMCLDRLANATFIHGHTGHTACCLVCALELQRRQEPCPVCRQHFTNVIRNFMAA